MTDFHSVTPNAVAAAKKQKPKKHPVKGNGHGRKLTPTYKNKTNDRPRTKLNGAPLMKNGVVGFDMGAYGTDSAPADSHVRPLKASSVITTILTIAICFVLLTGVLAGRARLSNYSQQNAGLENSIAEMEERISKLKMQIALEEDLGNIQERASALGLSNPDDAQIEYVDLDATDEVKAVPSLTLSQGSSSAPDGLLGAIAAWLDTVMLESGQTELSSADAAASGD
ncbi:MAG: hypothetical protein HDQ87_11280 [Clostridia bacterium]|nr:hypothetical protein [Clostridia bacterium]